MRLRRFASWTPILLLVLLANSPRVLGQTLGGAGPIQAPGSYTLGPRASISFGWPYQTPTPTSTPTPSVTATPRSGPPPPPPPPPVGEPWAVNVNNLSDYEATVSYGEAGRSVLRIAVAPGLAVDVIETRTDARTSCEPEDHTHRAIRCPNVVSVARVYAVSFNVTDAALAGRLVSVRNGLHLIGVPSGTVLSAAAGPQLAFDAETGEYLAVAQGEPLEGGRGYWVRFRTERPVDDVLMELAATTGDVMRSALPAGRYVLIGNPHLRAATVEGADFLYRYSPAGTYVLTDLRRERGALRPAEGAWVFSQSGGTLTIRSSPLP